MQYECSSFYANFSLLELVRKNRSSLGIDFGTAGVAGGGGGGSSFAKTDLARYQKTDSFSWTIAPNRRSAFEGAKLMQALAVLVENEISHRGANVRESGKVPSGFYAEYDDEGIQGRIELTINLSGHNTLDLRATLNETSSTQKQAVIENRLPFHKPSGNYHLVRFSPEDSRATTDEFIEKGRRTIKESAESLGHKMAVNHSMRNDTLQALLQSIEYAEVFVWTPLSSDHKQRLRALTGQEIVVPAEYDQYNKIYFLNDAALRMYRDLGETFEVWKMISPDEMAVIPGPSLRGPYLSKSAEGKQLTTMNFKLEDAKVILRNTPATLHSLLENLPQEWVVTNEGPDTWSPFDILGHLIHGEETDWIPRARMILGHGEARAFEPFDRFAMFEKSKGKSLTDLLAEFTRLREANLQELERLNLTPELLEKRGKHPELGVVTLSQLLSTWVVHDLGHIGQIVRVMSKQYKEAVGPWQEYLPILNR